MYTHQIHTGYYLTVEYSHSNEAYDFYIVKSNGESGYYHKELRGSGISEQEIAESLS